VTALVASLRGEEPPAIPFDMSKPNPPAPSIGTDPASS
jgi:hypothetical protein